MGANDGADTGAGSGTGRSLRTDRPSVELSVVIPVYNERDNIGPLDRELRATLEALDRSSEIVYVDDASDDGSRQVLDELVGSVPQGGVSTLVAHFRRNYGQTSAMAAGFELARGRVIVPMDGDLQTDPRDIPALLERLEDGYDVVSGWRRSRKDGVVRTWLSRVANWLIGRRTGLALHDFGCTLKAYRAEVLDELKMYGEMHRFLPAYLAGLGARVTEVEVGHRPRLAHQSKYGSDRVLKVFLDLFLLSFMTRYSSRPMHFFGQAALLFFALLGVASVSMVVFKYGWLRYVGIDYQASFVQTPLPGLAATFLLGGIISVFIGVLGELLIRVRYEALDLRPYVVESTTTSDVREAD